MDHAALVARVSEVCPLPQTATRVMSLTRDPNSSWEQICRAVEADPALATEILRVGSSPIYRTRYHTADLRSACRMLGQRELHDLTAAMAMLATFRSEHELALHAHEVGALAGQLASRTAARMQVPQAPRAFLAGLLSELGALACLSVDADAYVALRAGASTELERVQAEQRRYGATSFAIGGSLLARNGLAPDICKAVHGIDNDPISVVVRFSRRAAVKMLEASHSHDAGWLTALGGMLAEEGMRIELEELYQLADEAYTTTASRYRELAAP